MAVSQGGDGDEMMYDVEKTWSFFGLVDDLPCQVGYSHDRELLGAVVTRLTSHPGHTTFPLALSRGEC